MKFENIYWPDSDLENVYIEYDHARLSIWNDVLQKRLHVECSGFAGITNLCIWDDTTIMDARVYPVCDADSLFMRNLYAAYDKNADYGRRSLSSGLRELRIELSNNLSFSLYCQKIEVVEKTGVLCLDRGN